MSGKIEKSDADWKSELTPEQYHVLRERGTERPFSGDLTDNKRAGLYFCAGCGQELFTSGNKYDSGSGWPSFSAPAVEGNIEERPDHAHGMSRVEVVCAKCGGHLGHVFPDGPRPTGLRYCINSASIRFSPRPDNLKGTAAD